MAAKYSLLLLALFAINSCNCFHHGLKISEVELLRQSRTLVEDIKTALNDLQTLITTSVNSAFTTIDAGLNKFPTDLTAILTSSDNTINSQTATSLTKITQLEVILKAMGQPITCTASAATDISDVGPPQIILLNTCADTQISQSTTAVGTETEKLNVFDDTVDDLKGRLENCGEGIGAVTCLVNLQRDISAKRRTVPNDTKAIANSAVQLLVAATEQVRFCGFTAEAKVIFGCANIVRITLNDCTTR